MSRAAHFESNLRSVNQSRSVDTFYRVGYACHGAIHAIIGYLALSLALGEGGKITGAKGALATVAQQPFGKFILLLLGVGMLGFVAWRFTQAFSNIGQDGREPKSMFKRLGYAGSGLVYLSVAYFAIRSFLDGAARTSGGKSITAEILSMPAGKFILMAVGIGIIVMGVEQIVKGVKEKFMDKAHSRSMSAEEKKVLRYSGKIGLPARGITLSIIGYLFIRTGLEHQPRGAGTKGALELLMAQPYGTTILTLIAVGFLAYAVYCFLAAKYQRFAK